MNDIIGNVSWNDVYAGVADVVRQRPNTYFFRGHADATWPLLPGLARADASTAATLFRGLYRLESSLYFRFTSRAGSLLRNREDSWSNLFEMQHHGLPTRLLDWSRSFSVALYFALQDAATDAAVWMLDPFELNERTFATRMVPDPSELTAYDKWFLVDKPELRYSVIALEPPANSPRILGQRGAFTLHCDMSEPLDVLSSGCLTKITIPTSSFTEAQTFLEVAGISAFTLFPDLDGLARAVRQECL